MDAEVLELFMRVVFFLSHGYAPNKYMAPVVPDRIGRKCVCE